MNKANAGGLPLQKGVQDTLPLCLLNVGKVRGGVLGNEVQGLEGSFAEFTIGKVWELFCM